MWLGCFRSVFVQMFLTCLRMFNNILCIVIRVVWNVRTKFSLLGIWEFGAFGLRFGSGQI